jgi:hypothetical protein
MLDAGHQPEDLRAVLAETPLDGVRAGAAVLEHRVTDLCRALGVDAGRYELPAPRTAQQEWNDLFHLVLAAKINHLAARPTADLADERHSLTDALSRLSGARTSGIPMGIELRDTEPEGRGPSRSEGSERLAFIEAALNRQTTDALLHAKAEPAGYLTALLGPRLGAGPEAHGWDEAAGRVEHYRHHVLGLPWPGWSDGPGWRHVIDYYVHVTVMFEPKKHVRSRHAAGWRTQRRHPRRTPVGAGAQLARCHVRDCHGIGSLVPSCRAGC